MKIVYQGGQHRVECDGKDHYIVDKWGRKKDGKCWCKQKEVSK